MQLYFIRHGETPWNKARRFQGQIDIPLNDYGRFLAQKTREGLADIRFDRVFCSPLGRARETAEILLSGVFPVEDIVLDDRLKELGFGAYEGVDIRSVAHDETHPLYSCLWSPADYIPPQGAESFSDLVERAHSFLQDVILPLESEVERVLVVAHGALNRAMVVASGHKEIAEFWSVPYHNCCVTRMTLQDGTLMLDSEAELYYTLGTDAPAWSPDK